MTMKLASFGAAAIALLALTPAQAFTFHPATPAEIKQTDDLNAQSLAAARSGQVPATTQASFSNSESTTTSGTDMKAGATTNATTPMTNTKAGAGSEVTTPSTNSTSTNPQPNTDTSTPPSNGQ